MTLPGVPPDSLMAGAHNRLTLARHGVHGHHLRRPEWTSTNRGVWAFAPSDLPPDPWQRILRAAPVIPRGGAIGGWGAAFAHGAHDLDGVAADGEDLPVPLCLPRDLRCRRTNDLQIVRSDLEAYELVEVQGVRVTAPARTIADLARLTARFDDAVAHVDAMLNLDESLLRDLVRWLDDHPRRRGVAQARRVARLARPGTESRAESRLRVMWVLDAALPEPLVNQWVYARSGKLLGRADLIDPEAGVVGEYDGAHHAAAERRSNDHRRREAFQQAGLVVVQHTSVDLSARREFAVARLRRVREAGMRRDRSRDQWALGAAPAWAT